MNQEEEAVSQDIQIIAFAHRGEARAFLSSLALKPSSLKENLFVNSEQNLYLLIAGEGLFQAATELSIALGLLMAKHSNERILAFNFGVCGALENSIELGEVYEVRTIYSTSNAGKFEFKSFTTPPVDSKNRSYLDLISSHERVLDTNQKQRLGHIAQLVDREAWGFAYAAAKAGVSIEVHKLVSDYAEGEICQVVKDQAEVWSEKLLGRFESLTKLKRPVIKAYELPKSLETLHITVSQQRRLINLFKALSLKGISESNALESVEFTSLLESGKRPKEITKELIANLHALLYPLNTTLQKNLEVIAKPLAQAGLQVKFDQDLEREVFHISGSLESKEQIQKAQLALKDFPYEHFVSLLRGQDVQ